MNEDLRKVMAGIDNFGFSESFGLAESAENKALATNVTANKQLQKLTEGCSTAQLTVSVAKTGTGSGNTYNPVFLFGGDAFTSASKGYTVVQLNNPVQVTASAFSNSKNVITFTYADPADTAAKKSVYTVSQSTAGEYPFWLNQLTGGCKSVVNAMQLFVADAAHVAQLNNAIKTFELDQYGKAQTNDLTAPKDLYQYNTNGIWYANPFEISSKRGIVLNVNETDGMVLNLFMYVKNVKECSC